VKFHNVGPNMAKIT